jgi:hypothetical protein
VACGDGDALAHGAAEETPQPPGRDAHASDCVGEPDADGASAT